MLSRPVQVLQAAEGVTHWAAYLARLAAEVRAPWVRKQ